MNARIREFRLDGGRISVGDTLREFRGVLTGVPMYEGPDGSPHGQEAAVIRQRPRWSGRSCAPARADQQGCLD